MPWGQGRPASTPSLTAATIEAVGALSCYGQRDTCCRVLQPPLRSAKALPEKGASPGNKVTEPTSLINKNYIAHYIVLKVFIHVSSSRCRTRLSTPHIAKKYAVSTGFDLNFPGVLSRARVVL